MGDINKGRIPAIRFKGFSAEWKKSKLGDVVTFFKGSGYSKSDLTESGTPIILYGRLYTNYETVITNVDTYAIEKQGSILSEGGEVIIPASGETPEEIARASAVMKDGVIIAGDLNILKPNPLLNSTYLAYHLSNGKVNNEISKRAQGKSVVHLHSSNFKDIEISLTLKDEQLKIGEILKHIDDLIVRHQHKLEMTKQLKKTMLLKMFPKEGKQIPDVRFNGFIDDWVQRKLSEMTEYKNGKGNEDKQSAKGKYELINLNSVSIDGGLKSSGKFIDISFETLNKNDLVMILSDVGLGNLLGRVAIIPKDNRYVLNQRVALLRPNELVDPLFLFCYINAHQKYFKAQGAGMSQLNISRGSVENFSNFVPIFEEQTKIGQFFKNIDDIITLQQKELDILKEMKKTLLKYMFV